MNRRKVLKWLGAVCTAGAAAKAFSGEFPQDEIDEICVVWKMPFPAYAANKPGDVGDYAFDRYFSEAKVRFWDGWLALPGTFEYSMDNNAVVCSGNFKRARPGDRAPVSYFMEHDKKSIADYEKHGWQILTWNGTTWS